MLYGEDWLWAAYGRMLHSVRTGDAAFAQVHGMSFYDFLDRHSEPATQFQEGMTAYSHLEASAIAEAYTFAENATVVDVGGGRGTLLALVLAAHPTLNGVLFDQPEVVPAAERAFAEAGLTARARAVEETSSRRCLLVAMSTCSRACCTTGRMRMPRAFSDAAAARWPPARAFAG